MKTTLLIFVGILLFSCAGPKYSVVKPGASEADRRKDIYECQIEARHVSKQDCNGLGGLAALACQNSADNEYRHFFITCLEVRGYTITEK